MRPTPLVCIAAGGAVGLGNPDQSWSAARAVGLATRDGWWYVQHGLESPDYGTFEKLGWQAKE